MKNLLLALVLVTVLVAGYLLTKSNASPNVTPPVSPVLPVPVPVQSVPLPAPALPLSAPVARTYYFSQGKDSNLGDLGNAKLDNDVPGLKAACDQTPGCVGFNTNSWLKGSILPQDQWNTWTADPTKGLYTINKY